MKKLILLTFLISLSFYLKGQTPSIFCSNNESFYKRAKTDLAFKQKLDSVDAIQNEYLNNYISANNINRAGTVYYIPVVYHVLHEGGLENISDDQIMSDLAQMNQMFRKQNPSVTNVNPVFAPIAADVEIEFVLAQRKNDGSCFSGITRTYSPTTNTGGDIAVSHVRAHHGDFPGDKYLNIFISKDIGGAAGYTHKPLDTLMENGIHVLHTYVGTIGTSTQTIENSTTAHEAGHWLNLDHTWGGSNSPADSANCSMDDGVNDTPLTIGWNTCNTNGSSCGSLDNTENIMEYSYCPNSMFTTGQKDRMRAAIISPVGNRMNVISASNHIATGIFENYMCEANFITPDLVVCENEQIQFFDRSNHGATSWNWSFPGGTPSTSTLQNPIVTYSNYGFYDVSLTATNASGSATTTKSNYVRIEGYWGEQNYSEGFESANKNWESKGTNNYNWVASNKTSFSGNNSLYLENYTIEEGNVATFYSPNIDLNNRISATLNFQYGYAHKNTTSNESLRVYISNNCGKTWTVARGLIPTIQNVDIPFTANLPNHWLSVAINLSPAYFVSNFRFKIELVSGGGNNIYIDDINISGTVGVNKEENLIGLSLYPNPALNKSTIKIDANKNANLSIELLNIVGKSVKTITQSTKISENQTYSYDIDKGNLTSGVYFVKVTVNNKTSIERLIFK